MRSRFGLAMREIGEAEARRVADKRRRRRPKSRSSKPPCITLANSDEQGRRRFFALILPFLQGPLWAREEPPKSRGAAAGVRPRRWKVVDLADGKSEESVEAK